MMGPLTKVILIVYDDLTKESSIVSWLYAKRVIKLVRQSGLLFTALYQKPCSSSLQRAYAGDRPTGCLPVPVTLTRSGYPRIIPSFHRKLMYKKDERADALVRLYLSWFSLSKWIPCAKRKDSSTFKSITCECEDKESVMEVVSDIKTIGKLLLVKATCLLVAWIIVPESTKSACWDLMRGLFLLDTWGSPFFLPSWGRLIVLRWWTGELPE